MHTRVQLEQEGFFLTKGKDLPSVMICEAHFLRFCKRNFSVYTQDADSVKRTGVILTGTDSKLVQAGFWHIYLPGNGAPRLGKSCAAANHIQADASSPVRLCQRGSTICPGNNRRFIGIQKSFSLYAYGRLRRLAVRACVGWIDRRRGQAQAMQMHVFTQNRQCKHMLAFAHLH